MGSAAGWAIGWLGRLGEECEAVGFGVVVPWHVSGIGQGDVQWWWLCCEGRGVKNVCMVGSELVVRFELVLGWRCDSVGLGVVGCVALGGVGMGLAVAALRLRWGHRLAVVGLGAGMLGGSCLWLAGRGFCGLCGRIASSL